MRYLIFRELFCRLYRYTLTPRMAFATKVNQACMSRQAASPAASQQDACLLEAVVASPMMRSITQDILLVALPSYPSSPYYFVLYQSVARFLYVLSSTFESCSQYVLRSYACLSAVLSSFPTLSRERPYSQPGIRGVYMPSTFQGRFSHSSDL